MNYLLDTVVVIRHFSDNPNIGKAAKTILENVTDENLFFVSIISLMEILYLSERSRIPLNPRDEFNNTNISRDGSRAMSKDSGEADLELYSM